MLLFRPNFLPSKIYVIGAGGTGSRLIPLLTQFCAKTVSQWLPLEIVVIDPDTVEEGNLTRQNFIQRDVGQYKASVVAQRYGAAMNFPITPVTQNAEDYFDKTPIRVGSLFIFCVDSLKARQEILKSLRISKSSFENYGAPHSIIVDGGNEASFGQVKVCSLVSLHTEGFTSQIGEFTHDKGRFTTPYIPFDTDYFERDAPLAVSELSCADLDQTLAINNMVAAAMMGVIQNIYYRKGMTYDTLRFDLNYGFSSEALRWDNFFAGTKPLEKLRSIPSMVLDAESSDPLALELNQYIHEKNFLKL
jgi:molybdopterin/thiamine biosynthesis adenylyltransferase